MKHKYLDEINVTPFRPKYKGLKGLKRWFKHQKQYRQTGVPCYECWDLEQTMYVWMYEHVCQYYDDADKMIDLDHHTFTYLEAKYTQRELLLRLKSNLEHVLKHDANSTEAFLNPGVRETTISRRNEIFDLFKILAPSLWW